MGLSDRAYGMRMGESAMDLCHLWETSYLTGEKDTIWRKAVKNQRSVDRQTSCFMCISFMLMGGGMSTS